MQSLSLSLSLSNVMLSFVKKVLARQLTNNNCSELFYLTSRVMLVPIMMIYTMNIAVFRAILPL